MRAVALALLLALPAFAQQAEVTDAGVLIPNEKAVELAQRIKGCEVEREELRKSVMPTILISGGVGLVVGGLAVLAVALVAKPNN